MLYCVGTSLAVISPASQFCFGGTLKTRGRRGAINQGLLKTEVLITNKIQTEQDIALVCDKPEKISKHTISNRKLLKGPYAWGSVPNQQILLPYSFCCLSESVPLFFTYLACKEEIPSQLMMITVLSLTWVAKISLWKTVWDKDLFAFIWWFLRWCFWSPRAIKNILTHTLITLHEKPLRYTTFFC